jgi:hypothetical protein
MNTERLTFADCVLGALADAELIARFDRLTGRTLGFRGSLLAMALRDAGGGQIDDDVTAFIDTVRVADDLEAFVAFVRVTIWDRMPAEDRCDEQ